MYVQAVTRSYRGKDTLWAVCLFLYANFNYKVSQQVKKFNKKVSQKVLTNGTMCDIMYMSQGVTFDVM